MRIGLNPLDPQRVSTEPTSTSAAAVRQAGVPGEDADTFSSGAVTQSALASRALQMPEVRQEKVESLRQSIASGQYEVDAQSIAAAMLGNGTAA
jgi:negative regulator of flagellin synthesis FlgM